MMSLNKLGESEDVSLHEFPEGHFFDLVKREKWDEALTFLSSTQINDDRKVREVNHMNKEGEFNTLARAVFMLAPYDLIKMILDIGGDSLLRNTDKFGNIPLHDACAMGSPKEVFELLIKRSNYQDFRTVNEDGLNPLDNLFTLGDTVVDHVHILESRLYEIDPEMKENPSKSLKCLPPKTLQALLIWADGLPHTSQDKVLRNPLLKGVLNEKFSEQGIIAILLADIYVKLLITWAYSFLIFDIINDRSGTTEALILFGFCFYWRLSREISQLASIHLKSYLTDPVNWFDVSQIIFLGFSVSTISSFDGNLSLNGRLTFMVAMGVSWIELIFSFGIVAKEFALFAVALIKIAGKLIPFFITTMMFLLLSAHLFLLANAGNGTFCDSDNTKLNDWTCTIPTSYFHTMVLFLTGELAYDTMSVGFERWAPSILFEFAIGFVFMNISIAVITDAYTEAKIRECRVFTRNRLAFACGSESLISIVIFKRFYSKRQIKDIRTRKPSHRLSFSTFPRWKVFDELRREEEYVLKWWFKSWSIKRKKPSFSSRMKVFYQKASWDEIIFPGKSFENILVGIQHKQNIDNFFLSLLVRLVSYLVFFVTVSIALIVFLAGCLSFGFLWPDLMRRSLFHERLEDDSKVQ